MSDDGGILEKERRDALIYGFSGEIHTGKLKLSRKEYAMLRSAIKSGKGLLSVEMYYGTAYAENYQYLFAFEENGGITVIAKQRFEEYNIHEHTYKEEHNEYSRLLHRRTGRRNSSIAQTVDQSGHGRKDRNYDIGNDGRNRDASSTDRFSGAEPKRFDGRDRTGSDSDREGGGLEPSHNQAKQKYSFAGENARTADREALQQAKEMQRQGEEMETIRRTTGWHRGRDGKWRFEIDDSTAEYRRDGDARLLEEEGYQRPESLTDKWQKSFEGGAEMSEAEETEMERLQDEYSDRLWEEKFMLRDFLKHDALFEAYPRLKSVGLVFDRLSAGEKGYFSKRGNTIVLSDQLLGEKKATLLHEIQHVLQRYEGFASGSGPFYWATKDYESGEALAQKPETGRSEILKGLNLIEENQYLRYMDLEDALMGEGNERYDELEAEQDALYKELWHNDWFRELVDIERQLKNPGEVYNKLYRNTAGEIEARDTAARQDLTAQERRDQAVDYGDENTVFAENGADAFSIARTEELSWEKQIEKYFRGDGRIRRNDYLYIGECEVGGRNSVPLVIPTSVITKAIRTEKGNRSGHRMTRADIMRLKNGIQNAVAVVDNPSRNALVFITNNQDAEGNYIIAAFDKNNTVDNKTAHRATTIHGRENIAALLQKLGSDATIFLENENRLNRILPRSQILKSLTLTAKVEPMGSIISSDRVNVKQKFSVEEETLEMDEAARRIAQEDPIRKETRAEADPAATEKKRQKAEAKTVIRYWLFLSVGVEPRLLQRVITPRSAF